MSHEYQINIGTVKLSLSDLESQEIPRKIALKAANRIAERIRTRIKNKFDPDYNPQVYVKSVQPGSWLVDLSINFDFWISAVAIYKFIKEYKSIKSGLEAISKDIKAFQVSRRRWFTKVKFNIKTETIELSLLEKDELKVPPAVYTEAERVLVAKGLVSPQSKDEDTAKRKRRSGV